MDDNRFKPGRRPSHPQQLIFGRKNPWRPRMTMTTDTDTDTHTDTDTDTDISMRMGARWASMPNWCLPCWRAYLYSGDGCSRPGRPHRAGWRWPVTHSPTWQGAGSPWAKPWPTCARAGSKSTP